MGAISKAFKIALVAIALSLPASPGRCASELPELSGDWYERLMSQVRERRRSEKAQAKAEGKGREFDPAARLQEANPGAEYASPTRFSPEATRRLFALADFVLGIGEPNYSRRVEYEGHRITVEAEAADKELRQPRDVVIVSGSTEYLAQPDGSVWELAPAQLFGAAMMSHAPHHIRYRLLVVPLYDGKPSAEMSFWLGLDAEDRTNIQEQLIIKGGKS